MPIKALMQKRRGVWLVALIAVAALALLLAPSAIGRMVGGLWVATMSAVVSLIEALLGA
jgi:hypothetical protein